MSQVWQIAAGTTERNYSNLFLKHDIMFMGPGSYGNYRDHEKDYWQAVKNGSETSNKIGQIRSFVNNVKAGDVVLLRNVHRVVAIGIADEAGYDWNETFDDVYGWDLQHTSRIIWQEQLTSELNTIQRKTGDFFSHMKQIPTFSRVHSNEIITAISPLLNKLNSRAPKALPDPLPKPLDMDEIGQELFSKGLPNESVDKVILSLTRQRRMINWYWSHIKESGRPTEHEVVAHMILPLVLSLGWSEQLIAIEWNKIDLAAFWGTPTTGDRCALVCEAKGLGHGLQNVYEQAKQYTVSFTLKNCKKILLTDGARLYLYEKINNRWNDEPSGYLNVNSIRTNHIAPANTNAIETIIALTPFGIEREVGKG